MATPTKASLYQSTKSKHLVTSARIATVAARSEVVAAMTASRHTESVGTMPDRVLAQAA